MEIAAKLSTIPDRVKLDQGLEFDAEKRLGGVGERGTSAGGGGVLVLATGEEDFSGSVLDAGIISVSIPFLGARFAPLLCYT